MANIMKEETGMTGFRKTLSWTMRFSGYHEPWGGGSLFSRSDPLSSPSLLQEKVRLRYKLLFTMGDQTYNEMGDVDQFPPPETWGSL